MSSFGCEVREIKHEKSVIEGMRHVSTMTREVWVSKAANDIFYGLPDICSSSKSLLYVTF